MRKASDKFWFVKKIGVFRNRKVYVAYRYETEHGPRYSCSNNLNGGPNWFCAYTSEVDVEETPIEEVKHY
jgi:hypothetical protein